MTATGRLIAMAVFAVRIAKVLVLVALSSCSTGKVAIGGGSGGDDYGTKSGVFLEPSIDRNSINVRRVAIVPNRLPNNLLEPERWRKSNYEIIRRELQRNGFDVVDYATTIDAFERSGLPTEDTRTSRDKYAELCQQLGADAVFVPYYGTQAYSKGVFIFNTFSYISIATFQVYLAEKNDFLARIDASSSTGYTTGFGTLLGLSVGLGLTAGGSNTALAGSIVMAAGAVLDLVIGAIQSARAPEGYWEDSFEEAIKEGLRPFLSAIRPGAGGGGRPMGPPPVGPGYPPAPQRPYGPPAGYPSPPAQPQPYQPAPYPQQPQAPQPYPQPPPPNPYPAPSGGMPGAPQPYPLPAAPSGGCSSNADCKGGRTCVAGQCTSPSAAPAATPGCLSDADCKGGRACIAGQCTAR